MRWTVKAVVALLAITVVPVLIVVVTGPALITLVH